jgi:hypothetical protein
MNAITNAQIEVLSALRDVNRQQIQELEAEVVAANQNYNYERQKNVYLQNQLNQQAEYIIFLQNQIASFRR